MREDEEQRSYYDDEDDEDGLYHVCPHCHHEYDAIDFEYQICHWCKRVAEE